MRKRAPGTAGKTTRVEGIERTVREYEEALAGIMVDGIDLALANRVSFYISVQTERDFADPSPAHRLWSILTGYAMLLQARFRGTAPVKPMLRSGSPKVLFFISGKNPSVDGTIRNVLRVFNAEEARVVTVHAEDPASRTDHDWFALAPLLAARFTPMLSRIGRQIVKRQRETGCPILKRASLRAWLMRMALRTSQAERAFRHLFDALPTKVLVTASDTDLWGYCATLEAQRRGIPSVTIQHGMIGGRVSYVPVSSTRIAVWGEGSARWLREQGVPRGKIVVTGPTRLDDIANLPRTPRDEIADLLGADPTAHWVVLATNPIPFALNQKLLSAARKGVAAWGEKALLVVKLHPSEDPSPYRAVIGRDPSVLLVPHGTVGLYSLITSSAAVLTYHSTVGIEAMALDRPLVSLEAFGDVNPLPYARSGAAAVARSGEELAQVLREDVAPGHRAAERRVARELFVRENAFLLDGKCGKRVRDLVVSLARKPG